VAPVLEVAIFSFNRGAWLANCVESVQRNIPQARLRIHDDNSDDPHTLAVLAGMADFVVRAGPAGAADHGGLYANMQRALETAQGDFVLFLQDDMQIVRPVAADEIAAIAGIFDSDPRLGFLAPIFMKGERMKRYRRKLTPDDALRLYQPAPHAAPPITYIDTALAHVGRLREAGWRFRPSEAQNVAQALDLFGPMPFLAEPFSFFCPEVPIFRNRRQSLAARLASRIAGEGVKAFHDMTPGAVRAFKTRALNVWPVAEDFLTPTDPRVRRPFVYKDVKARWWLNALHRLEKALRR